MQIYTQFVVYRDFSWLVECWSIVLCCDNGEMGGGWVEDCGDGFVMCGCVRMGMVGHVK